jgi:hypothetical protein
MDSTARRLPEVMPTAEGLAHFMEDLADSPDGALSAREAYLHCARLIRDGFNDLPAPTPTASVKFGQGVIYDGLAWVLTGFVYAEDGYEENAAVFDTVYPDTQTRVSARDMLEQAGVVIEIPPRSETVKAFGDSDIRIPISATPSEERIQAHG